MKINHYMAYLRVAVDSLEDGRLSGRVYSQRLTEPLLFRDAADLLLQIEDLLDKQDFPRAFQRKRTFDDKKSRKPEKQEMVKDEGEDDTEPKNMDEETVINEKGAVLTFDIHVITRQNTTWQGYLDWLDGTEKRAYNSVLELLALITREMK